MSRTYRNSILLLAVVLGLSGRAFGSSTATITVNGAETAWDASTITISFNSFVETVSYGQFSTQAPLRRRLRPCSRGIIFPPGCAPTPPAT